MADIISQISQGLSTYVCAMLQALCMPEAEAKQATNAALVKQMLKVAETTEKGVYDLMAIKPLLIGVVISLNSHIKELQEEAEDLPSPLNEKLNKQAAEYHTICCALDKIVKTLEHSGGN